GLQQRAGQRRIGTPVAPGKARLRPHRPARAGIAEWLVVAALEPVVAAGAPERNAELIRAVLQRLRGLPGLPCRNRRCAGLEDARLLPGDVRQRRPQVLRLLEPE